MRRSIFWRTIISVGVAIPLAINLPFFAANEALASGTAPAVTSRVHAGGLSAAEVQRLAQDATQKVIVILSNQHSDLSGHSSRASRAAAYAADQAPLLSELAQVKARGIKSFDLVNAIAATVSPAEATRLASFAQVQAVVPDQVIKGPTLLKPDGAAVTSGTTAKSTLPPCTFAASLEPEALQVTNTAFQDPTIPQAQNIVTGTGVTVAYIADGIDPYNPDFIRPDGTPVFVDYEDFTGDPAGTPTTGGEAFLDASSIAAQGNNTYNVNAYVNTAHKQPVACPQIKILGVAPGASLMGLNVFGVANQTTTSNFVQAIQYAVNNGANVINESFGGNPYPDTANDPISLADNAAVAAGVTVVVSTGDAGSAGTLGSPSTDPNVIAVGATTTFRSYAQTVDAGIQLGNGGYVSNNISSISSGGISQSGTRTVDVVAPGDLNWALCSDNPALFTDCTDLNGNPTPIQQTGGTSESSPLTAGEAALVIQAYRQTHNGVTPSPALVKSIIKSTALNLGAPSYEQGAGLINSYKAVLAAMSIKDSNGSPTATGSGLLVSQNTLAATDVPNTTESFPLQVMNVGAKGQTVKPTLQILGTPIASSSYTVTLNPMTDPTFIDEIGYSRAYMEQDFTVPAGAQRLDAAISWDVISQPSTLARITLFDPQGRFTAYSIPQGAGQGYGHVDVRFPTAGTWRALIWTRAASTGYQGPVHLSISSSRFVPFGAISPSSLFLAPGQSGTFTVTAQTPAQPGDLNATISITSVNTSNVQSSGGAVPVILRSLVPLGPSGGMFTGTLTGGNGRAFSPGQTLTYQFNVPAGLKDLDLGLGLSDPNYNLEGILTDPKGKPVDVQTTITALDPVTFQPTAYSNTMQFFQRTPLAGRWTFVLIINNTISGAQTSLPFMGKITFNGVSVRAPAVLSTPNLTLAAGKSVTATIIVTNTGVSTKDFFVDPRLNQSVLYSLGGYSLPLPLPVTIADPVFFVPTESSSFIVSAETMTPTVPISMDITTLNGASPFGGTASPDIEATSFVDSSTGNNAAVAMTGPDVVPGFWGAYPSEAGPYASGATPSNVQVGATLATQQFDLSASPDSGDAWATFTGVTSAPYTPLTLAPGQVGKIVVTITPTATPGTLVQGNLYVDSFNLYSNGSDTLTAIPYSYTVSAH